MCTHGRSARPHSMKENKLIIEHYIEQRGVRTAMNGQLYRTFLFPERCGECGEPLSHRGYTYRLVHSVVLV
jgi:hypothetical protein